MRIKDVGCVCLVYGRCLFRVVNIVVYVVYCIVLECYLGELYVYGCFGSCLGYNLGGFV